MPENRKNQEKREKDERKKRKMEQEEEKWEKVRGSFFSVPRGTSKKALRPPHLVWLCGCVANVNSVQRQLTLKQVFERIEQKMKERAETETLRP